MILRSGALPTSPLEGEVLIGELQPGLDEIGMGGEKKKAWLWLEEAGENSNIRKSPKTSPSL